MDFYSSLKKSSTSLSVIKDFLGKCNLPKLDDVTVADLDADFTLDEVKATFSSFRNKAPGPDGFGAEFYKTYTSLLSPLLLRMFYYSKLSGLLPGSIYHHLIDSKKGSQSPVSHIISTHLSSLG